MIACARLLMVLPLVASLTAADGAAHSSGPDAPAASPDSGSAPSGTAQDDAAAQQAALQEAMAMALGAKIFAEQCVRCHAAPDPLSRNRQQWNAIALHMRLFADLSRADQRSVLIFLHHVNTSGMTHTAGSPAAR
jgi:hypothetical protein